MQDIRAFSAIAYNRLYHQLPYPHKCISLHGTRLFVHHDGNVIETFNLDLSPVDKVYPILRHMKTFSKEQFVVEIIVSSKKITVIDLLYFDKSKVSGPWYDRLRRLDEIAPRSDVIKCVTPTPSDTGLLHKLVGTSIIRPFTGAPLEYILQGVVVTRSYVAVGRAWTHHRKASESVWLIAGILNERLTIFGYCLHSDNSLGVTTKPPDLFWAPTDATFDHIQYFTKPHSVSVSNCRFKGKIINIPRHKVEPSFDGKKIDNVFTVSKIISPAHYHLNEIESILRTFDPKNGDALRLCDELRTTIYAINKARETIDQNLILHHQKRKREELDEYSFGSD